MIKKQKQRENTEKNKRNKEKIVEIINRNNEKK